MPEYGPQNPHPLSKMRTELVWGASMTPEDAKDAKKTG